MLPRTDIHAHVAASLRAARQEKTLSLDAVARLSGVSRSMVSQIERGESSPTVATLWNLTQALKVDFAGLFGGADANVIDVIRAADAPVIDGLGHGCRIRILSPAEAVGRTGIYEIVLDADGALESQPHNPGCRESLTVLDGALRVTSGAESVDIETGDTARYAADRAHAIAATGRDARGLLIVLAGQNKL